MIIALQQTSSFECRADNLLWFERFIKISSYKTLALITNFYAMGFLSSTKNRIIVGATISILAVIIIIAIVVPKPKQQDECKYLNLICLT